MPLGTFAPGYYTATYDPPSAAGSSSTGATDLGLVDGVRRLRMRSSAQMVKADRYGDSEIDGIYRGANLSLMMTFKEWTSIIREVLWPYTATAGDMGQVGISGRLLTDLAGQLVLTALTGTPAATAGPATITFPKAILAPENDVEIIFGNEKRDIPVVFKIFPSDVSGTIRWFSVT